MLHQFMMDVIVSSVHIEFAGFFSDNADDYEHLQVDLAQRQALRASVG